MPRRAFTVEDLENMVEEKLDRKKLMPPPTDIIARLREAAQRRLPKSPKLPRI